MKNLLIILVASFMLTSCYDEVINPEVPVTEVKDVLKINGLYGIKLENTFVTDEVSINVKLDTPDKVLIRIFDINNRVVSKEEISVKAGNNILKVYTTALPSSAYQIALYKSNGVMLGITDFNKIN
jgi:hypothetical protein